MVRCWLIAVAGMLTVLIVAGCLRRKYSLPPDTGSYDPGLKTTHTIAQLKALNGYYDYTTGGDTTYLQDDVVVSGIITADDRSGNFYKRIVVEDSTAALTVLIDGYNLYNDYPAGRKVYIRAKGLYLGYESGLPVIGSRPRDQMHLTGIPVADAAAYLIKAAVGYRPEPRSVSLTQVAAADPDLYNRLIVIREAEFTEAGQRYARPTGATGREIRNCAGNVLQLRTSNYADFAAVLLPQGRGTITGIYTVYTSSVSGSRTPQMVIRDTSDVRFSGVGCDSGSTAFIPLVSLEDIRRKASESTQILDDCRISGVVISDRTGKNTDSRNLVLQEGSRGVVVRFSAVHSFNYGDSLLIEAGGAQLGRYNGLLQLGALNAGSTFRITRVERVATGKRTAALVITAAALLAADMDTLESRLVMIRNAYISGERFAGNNQITDDTDFSGDLKLFTVSGAVFADRALPQDRVHITGITGVYGNVRQIMLRNISDVKQTE